MPIRCGSCQLTHNTVAEVRRCFSRERSFPRDCRHGLPPLWCVHCSWGLRRSAWGAAFKLKWSTKCSYCRGWMEEGEFARKRGSWLAHPGCVEDPARAADDPTLYWLDGNALGNPDDSLSPAVQSMQDALIEAWLTEARREELNTTWEMWSVLLADIDDDEMMGLLLTETLSDPDALTVELEA